MELRNALVVSIAGRDKGSVCVVLTEEGEYLFLADGKAHRVAHPKRKKRKHVRLLTDENGEVLRYDKPEVTDRVLRGKLLEIGRKQTGM